MVQAAQADPLQALAISPVDVSVLVVNYNTARLLKAMRDALMASQGGLSVQTVVVDNASRDDSLAVLGREFAADRVIVNSVNVGFGRANNQALAVATGRYVLLLNTDAFVAPDTLTRTVAYMDQNPACGVLGVRLVGRDGEPQPACRFFPNPWNVFLERSGLHMLFPKVQMVDPEGLNELHTQACDWVVGCYMLVRREVIERCGLFDPRYFLYLEEVDFCRRVKQAGWQVIYFPETTVVHLGGESAGSDAALTSAGRQISEMQIESELIYYRKNFGLAGLLGFVLLSWLTDFIHAAKWLARGRGLAGLAPVRKHAAAVRSLLVKTRIGVAPTR